LIVYRERSAPNTCAHVVRTPTPEPDSNATTALGRGLVFYPGVRVLSAPDTAPGRRNNVDDEYTPTTDEVREWTRVAGNEVAPWMEAEYGEQFDRWLAAHDREVAAKALEDAAENIEIRLTVAVSADGRPIKVLKEGTTETAREWMRNRAAEIREQS
jgi:hypothetical protein